MNAYLDGTAVTVVIPLQDDVGNPLSVASVGYRVVDQNDVELVPKTAIVGFVANAASVTITVPAILNIAPIIPQVIAYDAVTEVRSARTIELFAVLGNGNTVVLAHSYIVEPVHALITGVNTFQTYSLAQLTAMEVPGITGWDAATEDMRIAALLDARDHIGRLSFSAFSEVGGANQSIIYSFGSNLNSMTPGQYLALPAKFRKALRLAQIAEADAILGGNDVDDIRKSGLLSRTVGESSQMYRSGKPLSLPVCNRALQFLGGYITFGRKVTRV